MKKIKHSYRDSTIYSDTDFIYYTYEDISDEDWKELFLKAREKNDRYLNTTKKTKTGYKNKYTAKQWWATKFELYGIAISKPDLVEIITPTGVHTPFSWYEIKLKKI